jgi:hypothetical protein
VWKVIGFKKAHTLARNINIYAAICEVIQKEINCHKFVVYVSGIAKTQTTSSQPASERRSH